MGEEKVPEKMQAAYDAIVALTDKVCREYLNEEYAQFSRHLAATLCASVSHRWSVGNRKAGRAVSSMPWDK